VELNLYVTGYEDEPAPTAAPSPAAARLQPGPDVARQDAERAEAGERAQPDTAPEVEEKPE
jgi:hypothetical protein